MQFNAFLIQSSPCFINQVDYLLLKIIRSHNIMKYSLWFFLIVVVAMGCQKQSVNDSDDEINFSFHERNFGASADELMRADKYTSLIIEVQYMEGFKPDEQALANFKIFLQQHLHKPGGIFMVVKQIKAIDDTILSRKQVNQLRKANRTVYTKKNRFAMYILYTNGDFYNNHVLGQAFRNTSIVIYGKTVQKYAHVFSFPTQTTIETTLLLHEMGHLLGLVNEGSPMNHDHADSTYEAHCSNSNCIMYWNMSLKPEMGPYRPRTIPEFDSACLADLKANGGR